MTSHDAVVSLQVALHETVPKLDSLFSDLSQYSSLQLPDNLTEIYNGFINSYMELINAYGTKPFGEPVDSPAAEQLQTC